MQSFSATKLKALQAKAVAQAEGNDIFAGYKEAFQKGSAALVENNAWNVFTTVLTIYALFGDDCRLVGTGKSADPIFDGITITALVVFTMDLIASSVGKEDYFRSFFFYLDFLATASLVIDITTVAELIAGSGDSGSYAQSGAQAAKILRILRYKQYMDQQQRNKIRKALEAKRKRMEEEGYVRPGDDDALIEFEDDELADGPTSDAGSESRVGKKLSDMTTRRVIILVLSMLLIVPQFQLTENFSNYQSASQYGTDLLHTFLMDYENARDGQDCTGASGCVAVSTPFTALEIAEKKRQYELNFLRYLYSHNPHMTSDCEASACANTYFGSLLYVGFKNDNAAKMPTTFKAPQYQFISELQKETPAKDWDSLFNRYDSAEGLGFQSGNIPDNIKGRLDETWTQACKTFMGVAITDEVKCPMNDLRFSEYQVVVPFVGMMDETEYNVMFSMFDLRDLIVLEGIMSMLQTVFVCLVLAVAANSFGRDAQDLVLTPIERMIAKMHRIRDNPLVAMKLGDEEFRKQEIERKRAAEMEDMGMNKGFWGRFYNCVLGNGGVTKKKKRVQEPMETVILESTLIKLGGLLAVGFGVAGAEIIGQNMGGAGDSGGVNAMVAGGKVEAVFGFCNILNFSDATEILQDRVMVFVNQVAEVVHSLVDMYGGNANKNIGDAFLLVWKVSSAPTDAPEEVEELKVSREHRMRRMRMCDMSVVSFCFTIGSINKSAILAEYREHPGFLARFPGYRVSMGFGLHLGFAIEGAIGSEFKIDASYLSPNVNMASRLEAACGQFGTHLLMSHYLMDSASPKLRDACRQIDRVMVKGSKKPVGLFTCDLATGVLRVVDLMAGIDHKTFTVRRKYEVRQIRELKKNKKWADDYDARRELLEDPSVVPMRECYSHEFFQRFAMAFRNYIAGEWVVAREMLAITQCMLISHNVGAKRAHIQNDTPSQTLLQYMKQFNFTAPASWSGCRALTSK